MRCFAMTTLGLFFLVTPQVAAQSNERVAIKRPEVIKGWLKRLKQAEEALETDEWKKAKMITDDVLSRMCDRIEGGEAVASLLGTATFIRALSEAGLGNESAANWDYTAAQTLAPALSDADMGRFGAAGRLLDQWRLPAEASEEGETEVGSEEKAAEIDAAHAVGLIPPKKVRAPRPKYPFGKYQACVDGPIVVQIIIDEEGIPTHPRLLTTQDPLLGFAAMEALRNWRFKPARKDGEAVSVFYNLTVNFKLPICRNLFARAKQGADSRQ